MDQSYLNLFLDEASDVLIEWEKSCFMLELENDKEALESVFRGAHNLKSGCAAVGLAELSAFLHSVEDVLSCARSGQVEVSKKLIRMLLDTHTLLFSWLANVRTNPTYSPKPMIAEIEKEIASFYGLTSEPEATTPGEKEEPAYEAQPVADQPKAHTPPAKQKDSIRVPANKLDMLIQLVGELSTQQAILWHGWHNGSLNSKSCDNAIALMQKNTKDLHSLSLSLRMQPLESLFQRLERAARDLAHDLGKEVVVERIGDHVELDKVIIERITEPLMHLIRNAVDHGIESIEDRLIAGKTAAATLRLEGSQEPGGILIKLGEDGRGLDLDKILNKALEKGLASPDETYSPAEIQRFIFLHGFSTAAQVTDISGRGVGMDVVKSTVQSIGGRITIQSQKDRGTTFAISLPTTMSIVDSLIIEVCGIRYAVPAQDVSEIIDINEYNVESVVSGRFLSLRSTIIPLELLKDHLPKGKELTAVAKNQENILPALLVHSQEDSLVFQIDRIVGEQPVSIRALPHGLETTPGYTGATILGDGDACVILNLPALVQYHYERIGKKRLNNDLTQEHILGERAKSAQAQTDRHLIFHAADLQFAASLMSIREIISSASYYQTIGTPDHVLGRIEVRNQILEVIDLSLALKLREEKSQGPILVIESQNQTFAIVVDKIETVADLLVEEEKKMAHYAGKLINTIDLKNFANILSYSHPMESA